MHTVKMNRNYVYVAIVLLVAIGFSLLLPMLRESVGGNYILGTETYYHLNNLNQPTQVYDTIINFLVSYFGEHNTIVYLPVILIFLSLLIFSNLFKHFLETDTEYFFALIILVLTPAFLSAHMGLTLASMILFLLVVTIFLYFKSSYFYLIFLALLYLFDPFIGFTLTVALFIREIVRKDYTGIVVLFLTLMILVITSLSTNIHTYFINPDLISFSANSIFAFFGGRYGITLFLLVLGIMGIIRTIKNYPAMVLSSFVIIGISLFYEPARLFGIVVLVLYSARALSNLVNREWEINYIGQLVLILFFCMLLFSSMTFVKSELQQEPRQDQIETLNFLKDLPLTNEAKVLIMPEEAEYTTYYTGRDVLASSYRTQEDVALALDLFSSRQYSFVKEVLQEKKIGFIVVDYDVFNFLQFGEEGLLFVMENNDNFVKVYQAKGTQIYFFKLWNE